MTLFVDSFLQPAPPPGGKGAVFEGMVLSRDRAMSNLLFICVSFSLKEGCEKQNACTPPIGYCELYFFSVFDRFLIIISLM